MANTNNAGIFTAAAHHASFSNLGLSMASELMILSNIQNT
jgi:hypothetical protein